MKPLQTYTNRLYTAVIGTAIMYSLSWIMLLCIVFMSTCQPAPAQIRQYYNTTSWAYSNKGLYPNSLEISYNARNTALGLRYGYMLQDPVKGIPLSLYAYTGRTLGPDLRYNNYRWEWQFETGFGITLPHNDQSEAHTIVTAGIVYNKHPIMWVNEKCKPGEFIGDYYATTPIGCTLGIVMRAKHFQAHLSTDVINWHRYTKFGCGYTFSRYKSK